jgi:Coenzyme PQQ synthesis protein D (PqqD)
MVLLHRADHLRYSLNGFATRIWALLAKGASRRTIVARLRQEVGAPAGWLEIETAQVVERLLAAGLIERRAA